MYRLPISGSPAEQKEALRILNRRTALSLAPLVFSLLGATLTRALRHVRWSNVVPLVSSAHRPWWTAELLDVPPANILAQSNSRGTAPAILLALRHILEHDHDPTILVFPSDHGIDDESTLAGTLSDAVAIAEEHRHDLVLVGARPVGIENDYGWIVPENPGSDSSRVRAVSTAERSWAGDKL